MSIKEVLCDKRTIQAPFPTSLAVAIGDLLWWDNSGKVAKPANARTDTGSKAGNQADFKPLFLGVMQDVRLSTETSTGNDSQRVLVLEGVFDCDCASATFEYGDLVGVDRDATPLNMNQQVIAVADRSLAIGRVIKREGSAVTKVRCFLSAYEFGFFGKNVGPGFPVGAGGAVTQITNSATAVTLNKICGQITTVALTTAAGAEEKFTVNNNLVAATDIIVLSTTYNGAGGPVFLSAQNVAAGAFDLCITNTHSANALNAAMTINFAVIKGAAA